MIDFNGKERRDYVRLHTVIDVSLSLKDGSNVKVFRATTKDVSHGGMCICIQKDYKDFIDKKNLSGNSLDIDLAFIDKSGVFRGDKKEIWTKSSVEWEKEVLENGVPSLYIGLKFDNPGEELKKSIHNYIVNEFVGFYGKE